MLDLRECLECVRGAVWDVLCWLDTFRWLTDRDRRSREMRYPAALAAGKVSYDWPSLAYPPQNIAAYVKWIDGRGRVSATLGRVRTGNGYSPACLTVDEYWAAPGKLGKLSYKMSVDDNDNWIVEIPCAKKINATEKCGLYVGHSGPCATVDDVECLT